MLEMSSGLLIPISGGCIWYEVNTPRHIECGVLEMRERSEIFSVYIYI